MFIITEYFHPFSDSGGPIRSIENILFNFSKKSNVCILTSSSDYNNNPLPCGYMVNKIVIDKITGYKIAYITKYLNGLLFFVNNLKQNDIVYINGLFKPSLILIPILISNRLIICPRGMLQYNLLIQKSLVKNLYLVLLQTILFFKKVKWHATTMQEAIEIRNVFGKKSDIIVIPNIPVSPYNASKCHYKDMCSLTLVYYGLIVKNKGLLTLIQSLKSFNLPISLDIYGSIKDRSYWKECLQEINSNNSEVTFSYLGHANPSESQSILAKYDIFILLTKGENFGHSIFEALSVGTPVIITNKTPWKFDNSANPPGCIVNYDNHGFDIDSLKQALTNFYHMDSDAYALSSKAAHTYSVDFYNSQDFKKNYITLFNSFNE